MHAILALEIAIGIVALYLHSHRLDACIITIKNIAYPDLIVMSLSITHIHPHQHLRPVLRLRATCTSIDLQHTAHRVGLLMKHVPELKVLHKLQGVRILDINLLFRRLTLFRKVVQHLKVLISLHYLVKSIDPTLDVTHLVHHHLPVLGVVPKTISLGLLL